MLGEVTLQKLRIRFGVGVQEEAVIVNQSFVDSVLVGRSPIGQRFRYLGREPDDGWDWYEIVGVVGPFGVNPMNPSRDAGVYHPVAVGEHNPVLFLVETADPAGFVPRFRELVRSVDEEAVVVGPMVVADVMEGESRVFHWAFVGQVTLAAIAFLLSATGLYYALMSFTVAQRTREIGVRTALGAHPGRIVATIARRAAVQLGAGLLLGIPWAWVLLGEVAGDSMVMAFHKPTIIAWTLLGAAIVGTVACAPPTLRGLRIQPTEALREQ